MKDPYIKDLPKDGQTTLFAAVTAKDQKEKKDGQPYLNVELSDKTGKLDSKLWDDVESVGALFKVGDVVKVQGLMGEYRSKPQFTIKKLRLATPDEVDRSDFVACSKRSIAEMRAELELYVSGIETPIVQEVVRRVLADPQIAPKLDAAAAAMKVHHAFEGGLLEHICSLLGLAARVCEHYQDLDRDMLYAICILHDICKCVEMEVDLKISYTPEGTLIGHVALAYSLFNKHCDEMDDFPRDLRLRISHMILSHHGALEHGAVKVPAFPEAMVFHLLDKMDASMEMMRKALQEVPEGEPFSGWLPHMSTQVYKGLP